jgi:hypothetical protein
MILYGRRASNTHTDTDTDKRSQIQLNSIREAACRFLQLLEGTDLILFTECVRHSALSHRLVQNMCGRARAIAVDDVQGKGHGHGRGHEGRLGQQQNVELSEGQDERKYEGQGGGDGAHIAFAAHADLLCVVLRADTSRQHQSSYSSSTAPSPMPIPSLLTPLSSPQCFTDSLLAVYPQAPSHLLAALSDTLNSLTRILSKPLYHSAQVDTYSSSSSSSSTDACHPHLSIKYNIMYSYQHKQRL